MRNVYTGDEVSTFRKQEGNTTSAEHHILYAQAAPIRWQSETTFTSVEAGGRSYRRTGSLWNGLNRMCQIDVNLMFDSVPIIPFQPLQ